MFYCLTIPSSRLKNQSIVIRFNDLHSKKNISSKSILENTKVIFNKNDKEGLIKKNKNNAEVRPQLEKKVIKSVEKKKIVKKEIKKMSHVKKDNSIISQKVDLKKKNPSEEKKTDQTVNATPIAVVGKNNNTMTNQPVYNSDNSVTLADKNNLNENIYQKIIKEWKPPVGIPAGISCQVSFDIDSRGLPVNVVFEKKSGILMVDTSIKMMFAHISFELLYVGSHFLIFFTT